MIIGIDASRANKLKKTGVEWYSYYLIQNLKKIDKENHYFLYTDKKLRGELANNPENFEEKVLTWPFKYLWTQVRLSAEMLLSTKKPDILFVPAHTLPLIHPQNSVITIHDVAFARFPELYSRKELIYHHWIMKFIRKAAKKIITISQFSKKEIIKFYKINPEKIKVIYLGINKSIYRPLKDKSQLEKILSQYKVRQPFFLNIARWENKKNILGLIRAFKIFQEKYSSDFQLVLIGKEGYGFSQILEEVKKLDLEDKVHFVHWLSPEILVYFLNGATAFVFPSFYEGFGLPVLEAMACATPVIASQVSSLPEIAGKAALFVNPYQPEEIAQAMISIAKDENLAEELVNRGFDQIKKFSWEKCAQETLALLSTTTSQKNH